jgi:hypothetical protein
MAKKAAQKTTRRPARAAKGQERAATTGSSTPPPFLTADDVIGRERFQIQKSISLWQRDDGTTSLFVAVMNGKREIFTLSVRCAGPDRISLQQQCGRNLLDWPGKVIVLYVQESARGGRFVNVYDEDREKHRARSPRRAPQETNDDDIPF